MAGVSGALLLLNIEFTVVFSSLLLQGSSLKWLAQKLQLCIPEETDEHNMRLHFGDFMLNGNARMHDIAQFYVLPLNQEEEGHLSLSKWIEQKLPNPPVVGDTVTFGDWVFTVKELEARFLGFSKMVSKVGIKRAQQAH
ncbi:MAG: hypothetical protein MUE30_12195 [Spirosomaceae bacterium]|nr:hypothetical protein [Spirosomataceae bacterium]